MKLKFYFKSNGGNNFYLDDINLISDISTQITEQSPIEFINIFPNPSSENTTLTYLLSSNVKSLKITLKDVLGKEVSTIVNDHSFSAGKYTLTVDQGKKLAPGLYFIEFNADENIRLEKLIVR